MRWFFLPAALVAFAVYIHLGSSGVMAGEVDYAEVALKKAVEESVGTPLQEFWKDLYEAVVRKKGSQFVRRMRYATSGLLGKNDALELTRFLMKKLKEDVFDDKVSKAMWDKLTMELFFLIKDWWKKTPEDPRDAADIGAWQGLVNMYKDIMAPALRGSQAVEKLNTLLLDPELKQIREWVEDWRGDSGSGGGKKKKKDKKKKGDKDEEKEKEKGDKKKEKKEKKKKEEKSEKDDDTEDED